MDFEEYKLNVSSRFDLLSDEDQQQIIDLMGTPIGQLVISVLGNELLDLTPPQEEPTAPVRRGLAARTI
jgi:hypothetical protein|tara:strand:+ start:980 stop:1186 length:207 start_codon:yes stop_codon:yes gene_type:complete